MAKSPIEKQLEKAQKDAKQQAQKQLRETQKQAQEAKKMAEKEAMRMRAASIVNGQPLIEGMRVMDATAEATLQCILDQQGKKECGQCNYVMDGFPDYIQSSFLLEIEKLVQYGMVSIYTMWVSGGVINILPPAITYFDDKATALKKQEEKRSQPSVGYIQNSGNIVFGCVSNSTLTVDNSIQMIEQEIEEKGGDDKEVLYAILEEVKELMNNIELSRTIPQQKGLFQRISDHMAKHGWFYAEIVALLGSMVIKALGA